MYFVRCQNWRTLPQADAGGQATLQRRPQVESGGRGQELATSGEAGQGPPRPKVPNIYVKKPHRKQPALGLFLAKADPEDREDWRLKSGQYILHLNSLASI